MKFVLWFLWLIFTAGLLAWAIGLKLPKTKAENPTTHPNAAKRAIAVVLGSLAVALVLSAIVIVPAGHRGVIFSQANGVQKRILDEGFSIIKPMIESAIIVDVRIDRASAKGMSASKDIQSVEIDLVTNYRLDSSKVNWIYQNIGDQQAVVDKIIAPAVQEEVKAVTPRYAATDIIKQRHKVKASIVEGLRKRLAKANVILTDVSLSDIQFDPEFTRAIEEKTRAEQQAMREENLVRLKRAKAKQQIAEAEGNKQSIILNAQGEAEKNRLLERTLSPLVLQQLWIQKWDGVLPTYMSGSEGSGVLLNLPAK